MLFINIDQDFTEVSIPNDSINNIPTLVQIMAWRLPGASHYLNQLWLVYWIIVAIFTSLVLNELKHIQLIKDQVIMPHEARNNIRPGV